MTLTKVPTKIRKLCVAIDNGEAHRCAQETYDAVISMGLAFYSEREMRWRLTATGTAVARR